MKISKEIKIALVTIIAVLLVVIGINFFKGINIFKSSNSYYVKFKDIKGLVVTNEVYANGYPVGNVQEIDYNYDTNEGVVVRIELHKDMRIPRNTIAELETALIGGVTMNLVLGANPTNNIEVGDTILGQPKVGAMDKAAEIVPVMVDMLPKVDSILTHINHFVGNPALQKSLENVALMSGHLKNTTGKIDVLMDKEIPQILHNLNRTSANLEKASANVAGLDMHNTLKNIDGTVQSMQQLSYTLNGTITDLRSQLNSTNNTLGLLLNDKQLYERLNSTVSNADSLMIDLKANPKRYVHFSIFGRKK